MRSQGKVFVLTTTSAYTYENLTVYLFYIRSKNTVTTLPSCRSSCLRIDALIGRRYDPLFLSGKMLVSHHTRPILACTFTDHRHFLGIAAAISLIWSLTAFSTVKKYRDALSVSDRFRIGHVVVKWWSLSMLFDGIVIQWRLRLFWWVLFTSSSVSADEGFVVSPSFSSIVHVTAFSSLLQQYLASVLPYSLLR